MCLPSGEGTDALIRLISEPQLLSPILLSISERQQFGVHCSGFYGYPLPTHTVFYDYIVIYCDAKKYVVDVKLHLVGTEHQGLVYFLSSVLDCYLQGYFSRITKRVHWDFDNFGSLMATIAQIGSTLVLRLCLENLQPIVLLSSCPHLWHMHWGGDGGTSPGLQPYLLFSFQ